MRLILILLKPVVAVGLAHARPTLIAGICAVLATAWLVVAAPARAGTLAAPAGASLVVSDSMAQRMKACTPCHGAEGRAGQDGYYPRIAGKPAGYLFDQLRSFRDGRRNQAAMTHLLSHLSDDYLMAMADYFADLDLPYPPPVPIAADAGLLRRGERLVRQGDPAAGLPSCTACHGEAMTGRLPGTPGLLGLPRDYLVAQIGAWQHGQRRGVEPDCMGDIARRLKPDDVLAVTSWLASQHVPAEAHAVADDGRDLPLACARSGHDAPGFRQAGSEATATATATATAATPTPTPTPAPPPSPSQSPTADPIARGAYLARLGNCAGCHTARGDLPFVGGRGIVTPFGTLYAGNLTPDRETGLGDWTAEDFRRALRDGRSRDGRLLYPAFPYPNYSLVSDEDSDALHAFFRSLAPVRRPNRPHELAFPFDTQVALQGWRTLFFEPARFQPRDDRPAEWNRGDYLVRGLGHCDACHSPRNLLGAVRRNAALAGGELPGQAWYAPSLTDSAEAGVGDWAVDDIVALLRDGVARHGSVIGPMAEVVATSTRYFNEADLRAVAVRLKSLAAPPSGDSARGPGASTPPSAARRGAALYEQHCADCHGKDGRGAGFQPNGDAAGIYPPLAGNRAVALLNATNVIRIVTDGGFPPSTPGNPHPFGMPPFGHTLKPSEIADVISFIRQAWGNDAPAVTATDVERTRP